MSSPQDEESNLLRNFAEQVGDVPLLNRPASPLHRDYPLTGYRDSTDDNGKSNKEAAVEYLASLDSIPKDAEGKFNVFLLNAVDHEPGTAAPLEMFRRGLMEKGAHSFLHNAYPEWLGDATDDAGQDLESLQYMMLLKEIGYEKLNDDLNTKPEPDPEDDEDFDYPEDNILYLSFSAITQELFTLMTGREESKRLRAEEIAKTDHMYEDKHNAIIAWARETHGLELRHTTDPQEAYSPFFLSDDELTRYVIWDNPNRIILSVTRPNADVDWYDKEHTTRTNYSTGPMDQQTSTYPEPSPE